MVQKSILTKEAYLQVMEKFLFLAIQRAMAQKFPVIIALHLQQEVQVEALQKVEVQKETQVEVQAAQKEVQVEVQKEVQVEVQEEEEKINKFIM
jgi:hypothetical protein